MAVRMPARLLPAWRACFLLSFLCRYVEIHGGVIENRPLKKSTRSQIGDPSGAAGQIPLLLTTGGPEGSPVWDFELFLRGRFSTTPPWISMYRHKNESRKHALHAGSNRAGIETAILSASKKVCLFSTKSTYLAGPKIGPEMV